MVRALLIAALWLLAAWPAAADETSLRGFLEQLSAWHTSDWSVARMRPLAYVDFRHRFNDAVALRVVGRFWHDFAYALNSRYSAAARADEQDLAELREAYLDLSVGDFRARLGQQVIAWGEATAPIYSDVVNPKDLRDHVLTELDYIRTPMPAASLVYTFGDFSAQVIYLPFFRGNRISKAGGEFPFSLSGQPPETRTDVNPEASLANAVWGARLSGLVAGYDLSLMYLRSFNPFPVYDQIFVPGGIALVPHHAREHVLGVTMSKSLEQLVFHLEAISTLGQAFNNFRGLTLGTEYRDTLKLAAGVDYAFALPWYMNLQVFHDRILGWTPDLIPEQQHNGVVFRVATTFLEGSLAPELLAIALFDRPDYLLQVKTTYALQEDLKLGLEWDAFMGNPTETFFGQFQNRNRLALNLRYYFKPL